MLAQGKANRSAAKVGVARGSKQPNNRPRGRRNLITERSRGRNQSADEFRPRLRAVDRLSYKLGRRLIDKLIPRAAASLATLACLALGYDVLPRWGRSSFAASMNVQPLKFLKNHKKGVFSFSPLTVTRPLPRGSCETSAHWLGRRRQRFAALDPISDRVLTSVRYCTGDRMSLFDGG